MGRSSVENLIEAHRNIRASGGESVNCGLKGFMNNDVHIPLVEDPDEDEYSSIVVEPIPQEQPAGWTISEFRRLQKSRNKVMVYGQLFFDNAHLVRDDPDNEEGLTSQPKRFTVWEIHPVSRLFECTKANDDCDPRVVSDWKEIR